MRLVKITGVYINVDQVLFLEPYNQSGTIEIRLSDSNSVFVENTSLEAVKHYLEGFEPLKTGNDLLRET